MEGAFETVVAISSNVCLVSMWIGFSFFFSFFLREIEIFEVLENLEPIVLRS